VVAALAALMLTLMDVPARIVWWVTLVATACGTPPIMMSVVRNEAPGAVDNASGAAAVLSAAGAVRPTVAIRVLQPSAGALGLAGARAWARTVPPGIALNCDGVDDEGRLVVMYDGQAPERVVTAVTNAAQGNAIVRRMPLGLLTDSTALAERQWEAVTVSHG